jgi:hypothetical protein
MRLDSNPATIHFSRSLANFKTAFSKGSEEEYMRSRILNSMVALFFAIGASQALHAQSAEDARAQLLNLVDAIQELGPVAPPGAIDSDRLQNARVQIEQMSPEDIAKIGQAIAPMNLPDRLARARAAVAEYSNNLTDTKPAGVTKLVDTAPFPVANGECTSSNGADTGRLPTSVVLAADVIYFVAEGVKDAATDACNQVGVVVVAGEGGGANTSLACIATDAIYVAAHAVDEGIHFCDDDLTGAVGDANYARLDYINTNLNGVDTDLANGFGSLGTQVTNGFGSLGTQVSNSNAQIAGEFSALDTHITGLIAALSTQLTKDTIPTSGSTCNGVYGGIFPGNLTVWPGQNCVIVSGGVTGNVQLNGGNLTLSNAQVGGSLQISGGGMFSLGPGLSIGHDLQISNLPSDAGPNQVCGTMVHGNLQIQNNAGVVLVGAPSASPACAGNIVGMNLTVWNNYGATTVDGNTVTGNLQDQNNKGATQVFSNVVGNDLQCYGNASITGGGNTAKFKQGQCAAF